MLPFALHFEGRWVGCVQIGGVWGEEPCRGAAAYSPGKKMCGWKSEAWIGCVPSEHLLSSDGDSLPSCGAGPWRQRGHSYPGVLARAQVPSGEPYVY